MLVLAGGCASRPRNEKIDRERQVRFFFTADRGLEVTPCGCGLLPIGGIEREKNYLTAASDTPGGPAKTQLVTLTGGTTFVPSSRAFDPKETDRYRAKAEFLADAMKELGLTALGVSADDLKLGVDFVKALEARAGIPFLATNLPGKGFRERLDISGVTLPIRIYSVTGGDGAEDPAAALTRVLATEDGAPALRVLLSSLDAAATEALIARVPAMNVTLQGGGGGEGNLDQRGGAQLLARVPIGGRGVLALDIAPKEILTAFYNPEIASNWAAARSRWASELADLDAGGKHANLAQARRRTVLALLRQAEKIPAEDSPVFTRYQGRITLLDKQWDGQNLFTPRIQGLRERLGPDKD